MQRTINWLEDMHIRALPPAARVPLRTPAFPAALAAYLSALSAPEALSWSASPMCVVRWLTRRALQHATEDDADALAEPADPWAGRPFPVVAGAAASDEVAAVLADFAGSLGLDDALREKCGAGSADVAHAVADVLEAAVEGSSGGGDGEAEVRKVAELEDLALGFETGSEDTGRVARVMRLLYVRELRALQDRSNEALAAMQAVTADPRTDSRLGRVGR